MTEYVPFQQRVIDEKVDLQKKLNKLRVFLDGSVFRTLVEAEQDLLKRQSAAMEQYLDALAGRIARF